MSSKEKPGMSFEDFKREALKYSPEERAELRDTLSASLDENEDVEAEHRILEEVRRRYSDAKKGRTRLIPGEEAFAELRAEID
jgi:hypothetical protein